jgi:outer membrane protein assembly factor BamE (lipoprotein component of BamABCDE complex)
MHGRLLHKGVALALAACAIVLAGCSTTETRINEHPEIFGALSPSDQSLVSRGQIRGGMSQDAVWLAWGSPDQKVAGFMRGHNTETWVYTTTTSYPYGGYGYGPGWGPWGPYGPYGWGGIGFAGSFRSHHGRRFVFFGDPFYDPFYYSYIPTVTYPYKTVTFSGGRVVSFQYLVAPYR